MSVSPHSLPPSEEGKKVKGKRVQQGVRGQSQSCHQCRQSIYSSKGASEMKTGQQRVKCSKCTRYWCEKCLSNRYGIERSSLDVSSWSCPVCSGNCNCSLCRKKSGKLATGVLTPLVKTAGFTNVSEFLQKGTDDVAKCLQWQSPVTVTAPKQSKNKDLPPPTGRLLKMKQLHKQREDCVINHMSYSITLAIEEEREDLTPKDKENHKIHEILFEENSEATPVRYLRNRSVFTSCKTSRKLLSPKASRRRKPVPRQVVRRKEEIQQMKEEELKKTRETALREKTKLIEEKRKKQKQIKEEILKRKEEKRCLLQEAIKKKKQEKQLKQDKLRKAKILLMEARQQQIRQREELKQLLKKKKEEERRRKLVLQQPLTLPPLLTPTVKEEQPTVPLPLYPPLEVGVASKYVASLLFVVEFLNTFNEVLGINERNDLKSMCSLLKKRVLSCTVYDALLSLITSEEGEEGERGKDWSLSTAEEYAKKLIISNNDNGTLELSDDILESRIQLMTQLCTYALETSAVINVIRRSSETFDEEKRIFRNKKNDLIQKSMETLKSLSEGGASLDELAAKREELMNELQEHHKTQYPICASMVRHETLGTDRLNRLYWHLNTLPDTILVEDTNEGVWSVININNQLVHQVLESLNLSDDRESLLHSKLYQIISSASKMA